MIPAPQVRPAKIPQRARYERTRLAGEVPAAQAALLVAGDAAPFALTGVWAGGGAIAGSAPLYVAGPGDDPFALLDVQPQVDAAGDDASGGAVGGGWFGILGYRLAALAEPVPPPPPAPAPLPAAVLAFYDHVLRADRDGAWWFEALWTPDRAAALEARRDLLAGRLRDAARPRPFHVGTLHPAPTGIAAHRAAIAGCRERIAAGDLFQANLTLRLEGSWSGSAAALAATLASELTPDYGAFFEGPWGAVASASPELFLRRTGRAVHSEPIKGTAAGGSDAAQLAASAKDRAENVMIVDLMRNDLGRVCEYGTVTVPWLTRARPGAGVLGLVSRVAGTLRADVGDGELLRATFPPGSVTGAPKVEAMRVITELESTAREAYTGAIGYASPLAGLELNVAIRTFELRASRARIGVGGGITAASDPDAELEESFLKARPPARAAGAAIDERRPAAAPAPAPPAALDRARVRPDPAGGIFETILVAGGAPRFMDLHLARLRASVAQAYAAEVAPGSLEDAVARALPAPAPGALRLNVVVVPVAGALAVTAGVRPLGRVDRETTLRLVPWTLPGGLGAHKWRDRRLVDELARIGGGVPLLVDADGAVLEAAWASVWTLADGALTTPRLDGRLLPGVTRARLLECAAGLGLRACEAELTLADLRAAPAVLVTSSLRGAVPARLDDAPPRPADPAVGVIAAALLAAGAPAPLPALS